MATYAAKLERVSNANMIENIVRSGLTSADISVAVRGKAYYVDKDSTASGPDGLSWDTAFTTLSAAIAKCTANKGDAIFVSPGHTETVSAAAGIALSKAGVAIIGVGDGSLRPTITLNTATTASITVTAANITVANMIFSANFADIVTCFDVVAAKNFKLFGCAFQATAGDMNFLSVIDTHTVDNAADGLTVENCSWIEPDLATLSFLDVDADVDGLVFSGNYLNLGVNTNDLPAIAIVATGKDLTNCRIVDNQVIRLNDANPLLVTFDTGTANTGICARNYVRHLDTASELLMTTTSNIGHFENYATAVVDLSGYILPARDA